MSFHDDVVNTPDIAYAHAHGLQGIHGGERRHFSAPSTVQWAGSVDLDAATRQVYPRESRWDYIIAFKDDSTAEKVLFVEVHPCNTGEVDTMVKNKAWLTTWLLTRAPRINAFPKASKPFVWLCTTGIHLLPHSPQARRLATSGIIHVARVDGRVLR